MTTPKNDEDGYWTTTGAGGLYYHASDPATEDEDEHVEIFTDMVHEVPVICGHLFGMVERGGRVFCAICYADLTAYARKSEMQTNVSGADNAPTTSKED